MKTSLFALFLCLFATFSFAQGTIREQLSVDATDAPRNIIHSVVTIPATPGAMTLVYPKWIPGNHRPTGPIQNVAGLHIKADGREIPWQRDLEDMYALHLQVPAGARQLQVAFDTITYYEKRSLASSKVLDLVWNQEVMYPQGASIDAVEVTPSVRLPEGWKFGTALDVSRQSGDTIDFQPVSLNRLVDSPLIAGLYYRQVQLTPPNEKPVHVIDMVAESPDELEIGDKDVASYKQLVAETGKLFGARHYEKYHFLLTLSDETAHHGLEHHESSDNGAAEDMFDNPNSHNLEADLLPHEFTHSWNGKYRRPAGLVHLNYQQPMHGDLLWVYEGMTDFWGNILAARTGLRSPEQFRENLAYTAAMLDHRAGRTWRPLQDTATSVQILFAAAPEWQNWRRSADYYPEGYLIWLEVDSIIRRQTNGRKSLNDFCRLFEGPPSGPPKVITYNFDDVVSALNQVTPYDWAKLLRDRLDSKSAHDPMGGIENDGWKVIYNDKKNATMEAAEKVGNAIDMSFSLGLLVTKDGDIRDAIPGMPAYAAGIAPGMKIIAVNGRKWSKDVMRAALRYGMQTKQPLELLCENADYFSTYKVDYHDGEKYPHLVRNNSQPDVLSDVIKPLAPAQ
jgi:predicted metalloprotease with PDZ domain